MLRPTWLQTPRPECDGPPTVLFVDDFEGIRRGAHALLTLAGFNVLLAEDGISGLNVFEAHRGDIDVIVTDVVMPALGGPEMYRVIRDRYGHVSTLFLTGHDISELEKDGSLEPGIRVMKKPFSLPDLVETVSGLVAEATGN